MVDKFTISDASAQAADKKPTDFSAAQKEGYTKSDIKVSASATDASLPGLALGTGPNPNSSDGVTKQGADDTVQVGSKKVFDGNAIIDLRGVNADRLRELNRAAMEELQLNPELLRKIPPMESSAVDKK